MPVERLNPPGLAVPQAYTHVGIASGSRLVTGLGRAAARLGVIPLSPTTMVPVPRLASDGLLVEIDVTAVVD